MVSKIEVLMQRGLTHEHAEIVAAGLNIRRVGQTNRLFVGDKRMFHLVCWEWRYPSGILDGQDGIVKEIYYGPHFRDVMEEKACGKFRAASRGNGAHLIVDRQTAIDLVVENLIENASGAVRVPNEVVSQILRGRKASSSPYGPKVQKVLRSIGCSPEEIAKLLNRSLPTTGTQLHRTVRLREIQGDSNAG
jgi:hypothetical protein